MALFYFQYLRFLFLLFYLFFTCLVYKYMKNVHLKQVTKKYPRSLIGLNVVKLVLKGFDGINTFFFCESLNIFL